MTSHETQMLLLLGAGAFVLASTYTSINVALPQIQDEFDVSLSALKWVSIIGAIMVASLSLSFGRIGDLLGRRRVYQSGILVYTIGAGLTALSLSFPQLMASRVFMATGLAMSNPLAGAIIAATVAQERRGRAIGLFASFQAAGMLIGPTFGGAILDLASWRAIFVMYMGIGIVLCLAQAALLRGADERRPEAFDYLGAVLLVIGYPSLLIALSLGPGEGWGSKLTLLFFGVAAVGLAAFTARELRFDKPIFHFRFFRSPTFCIAMFTLAVASFVQNPATFFTPLYLQKVLNADALTVGLVMMALPISTLIAGPIGGSLSDRHNPWGIAAGGALLSLGAVLIYSRLGVEASLVWVVVALSLIGLGAGFFRPANQVAVYAQVEQRDYGAISAMLVLLQSLAGTMGTTIAVAINESRSSANDARSFTEGQQFAFTTLLPLLVISIFVSLFARKLDRPSRRAPVVAAEAPERRA
ncbi:MAG TPA: MFS transporter [Dehalococcoidia bacterium]|nr:MFS transporter [Dehalococcoidia bacterium]